VGGRPAAAATAGGGAADPYTFVTDIEPALVRREWYILGGLPTEWAAQGARLLSL
jgi:hypothetical protein